MNLDDVSEIATMRGKPPKKELLDILDAGYDLLDKDQIASLITLIEKMVIAKKNGEDLSVRFRDWNEDGTRRF